MHSRYTLQATKVQQKTDQSASKRRMSSSQDAEKAVWVYGCQPVQCFAQWQRMTMQRRRCF
jgi:hypothetical protein